MELYTKVSKKVCLKCKKKGIKSIYDNVDNSYCPICGGTYFQPIYQYIPNYVGYKRLKGEAKKRAFKNCLKHYDCAIKEMINGLGFDKEGNIIGEFWGTREIFI